MCLQFVNGVKNGEDVLCSVVCLSDVNHELIVVASTETGEHDCKDGCKHVFDWKTLIAVEDGSYVEDDGVDDEHHEL